MQFEKSISPDRRATGCTFPGIVSKYFRHLKTSSLGLTKICANFLCISGFIGYISNEICKAAS